MGVCVWRRGSLKRIPTTTRILLGALIPQNLKHINFSLQNSEKAVTGAQLPAKSRCLKWFTLRGRWKVLKHGSEREEGFYLKPASTLLGSGQKYAVVLLCLKTIASVIF